MEAFLIHGETHYGADNPFLTTKLWNIENPPPRDIEAGAYDLVIATSVLHATGNMRQTLRHAKSALRRNGDEWAPIE